MERDIYIYVAVMTAVTLAIRMVPALILRQEIKNVFVRSFLYYVPFVTLAVMTFPYMLTATRSSVSGIASFVSGLLLAYFGASLFRCAALTSLVVFVIEYVLI